MVRYKVDEVYHEEYMMAEQIGIEWHPSGDSRLIDQPRTNI